MCILYYFATPCSLEIYLTQKYLGDLISSSGNNTENIKERCKTGFKAISQIKALMKDVSMGKYTIQIGLLFRDTMFVSKMLLNSEVWHCLTQSQVQELEKLDRILIRHVFDAHSKTGLEWLYLDAGKLNLGSLIQIRRLMYLWHILSRDESELIRRVYETQKVAKNSGDMWALVEKDKSDLNINMSDMEIQGVSKEKFKNYVTQKVKLKFLKHIEKLKEQHSKSENLKCDELKTAEYIKSPRFSLKEKRLLFKLRSKTLDVKANFRHQHQDTWCISCGLFEETQSHLLQCSKIIEKLSYVVGHISKFSENDIYGSLQKQEIIIKVYSDILDIREKLKQNYLEEN